MVIVPLMGMRGHTVVLPVFFNSSEGRQQFLDQVTRYLDIWGQSKNSKVTFTLTLIKVRHQHEKNLSVTMLPYIM